jgi:predicted branched-subunit amino acid permease
MASELPPMQTRGSQFIHGVKAILPILLAVAPFGMIYGALARQSGLSAP